MSKEKLDGALNYHVFEKWFIGSIAIVVGSCILFAVAMRYCLPDLEARGQFGDQFGAVNALFSGLAFFGLIMALFLQSRDLRAQTKSLTLQNEALLLQIDEFKAQKNELAKAANAQAEMIKVEKVKLSVEVQKARMKHAELLASQVVVGNMAMSVFVDSGANEKYKEHMKIMEKAINQLDS